MLKPEFTGQFKRDYKLALKRGCDPKKLNEVVMLLCKEEPLPEAYRDHALVNSRNYKGMRECHIQWHPEAMLVASDDMLPVFTGLIEAAKKAADK